MNTTEYSIIDVIYPIGSIYMSVNTSNPSTLFPNTTWQKIEGMFLLGSSSSYTSGATGGSKDAIVVSHNHTQTSHTHTIPKGYDGDNIVGTNVDIKINSTNRKFPDTGGSYHMLYSESGGSLSEVPSLTSSAPTINNTGVSGTDKNMPPYLVVNIWERTA